MTTSQLIKRLQKYPPNLPVMAAEGALRIDVDTVAIEHVAPMGIINFNPKYHKVNKTTGLRKCVVL